MENTFKKVIIVICLLTGCFVIGQEKNDVNLTHIYNKWVLSTDESSNNNQIFRSEDFFEDAYEDKERPQRWRFATHSDVFINSSSQNNITRGQGWVRCPTGVRQTAYMPTRTKGIWEIKEENGVTSLLLHYYRAENGKSFRLSKAVKYLVIHLEEDLMELVTINRSNAL